MKHLIFVFVLLCACNGSAPVVPENLGECKQQLSEALQSEEAAWEYAESIEEDVEPDGTTIDWQARVKYCEPELLQCRAAMDIEKKQYERLYERSTDLIDALRYFDVVPLCNEGIIKTEWICKAIHAGNL